MARLRTIDPVLLLFGAGALAVTIQKGVLAGHPGNFLLFRATFHRLVGRADIYHPPPGEMTGFLYSPTFALLFAPFAVLPVALGLLLWNGVNALSLYWGIRLLLPARAARVALLIVFLDMMRSLQNSQSNALVAGLILLAFVALERDRVARGAAAILVGTFTKIYPLGAAVLGLIRPRPVRFLTLFLLLGLLFAGLPLLVLPPDALAATYREWWSIIQRDTVLQGQSVMGLVASVMGSAALTLAIQLAGTVLLIAPLVAQRGGWPDPRFRLRWLCSFLVFCVIFNHQAESASFVVASSGVAVWYVTSPRSWWRALLVALVLVVDTLPHLFFMPPGLYQHVIGPNALDALPLLVIWLVIQSELWRWKEGSGSRDEPNISSGEPVPNLA
ncbi:MAG TPA: glycosyltransferase family 87 protein [Gemmatimonadales bacterium]|nr:glycosyltransferase family 87 protein [Gemmatimonadales bacterium]